MNEHVMDGSGIKRLRLLNDMGEPDVIECDGADYVKQKTCRMILIKSGALYDVWGCSCCDFEYSESRIDTGASEIDFEFCPKCGSKVIE